MRVVSGLPDGIGPDQEAYTFETDPALTTAVELLGTSRQRTEGLVTIRNLLMPRRAMPASRGLADPRGWQVASGEDYEAVKANHAERDEK